VADWTLTHTLGPGLAIRITGAIDDEKLAIARQADAIFLEEINSAGLYAQISQAYAAVLGETRTVGVMGDSRAHGFVVQLRAVSVSAFFYRLVSLSFHKTSISSTQTVMHRL
jgi:GMP synthase PP-ATPase subunit